MNSCLTKIRVIVARLCTEEALRGQVFSRFEGFISMHNLVFSRFVYSKDMLTAFGICIVLLPMKALFSVRGLHTPQIVFVVGRVGKSALRHSTWRILLRSKMTCILQYLALLKLQWRVIPLTVTSINHGTPRSPHARFSV
jgi:hypothetical protein